MTIWRYRYPLMELEGKYKGKALVKFLDSASRKFDREEVIEETTQLLEKWPSESIELENILPLLSYKFAGNPIYNKKLKDNPKLEVIFKLIRSKVVKCL